ncbi:hypothetical protein T492DRAFT_874173 [Pavlovales sp. CCMP2436]|nr:hypothetical protein T492DRAFT_874173 [Pavlovales sp. CCMP2436]
MPYLTHADAEVAKAAEAEAMARSKIVTAPARKPVIAATDPARNGEAERIEIKAPKKGANKVGKEKSNKAPSPKQLKVWAEKHDVALVQYALAAGYPRLSVTGGRKQKLKQ